MIGAGKKVPVSPMIRSLSAYMAKAIDRPLPAKVAEPFDEACAALERARSHALSARPR